MLQKKDDQRFVELDQNGHSSTKDDETTSSSHIAKPNVGSSASYVKFPNSKENLEASLHCKQCDMPVSLFERDVFCDCNFYFENVEPFEMS